MVAKIRSTCPLSFPVLKSLITDPTSRCPVFANNSLISRRLLQNYCPYRTSRLDCSSATMWIARSLFRQSSRKIKQTLMQLRCRSVGVSLDRLAPKPDRTNSIAIKSSALVVRLLSTRLTITVEYSPRDVINMLERDFKDDDNSARSISQDDRKFLDVTSRRKQLEDGRYEVPMPFKEESIIDLECNIQMAEMRFQYLKRKMEQNPDLRNHYIEFMNENIQLDFCEEIPLNEISDRPAWYIPHQGKSLNDCLLTGPDMINNLTGVLLRFRKDHVAIQGDIKKMFPQFSVPPNQRNYFRYLWWKDRNTVTTDSHENDSTLLWGR